MVHNTSQQSRGQQTRKQAGGNQQLSGSDFVTLLPELNLCPTSSLWEQGDVPHHRQPILKMGNSPWALSPHPTKNNITAVCIPILPHWLRGAVCQPQRLKGYASMLPTCQQKTPEHTLQTCLWVPPRAAVWANNVLTLRGAVRINCPNLSST